MNEPVWVLPELVLTVHQVLLAEHGGLPGIREHALLDSSLARPQQKLIYENEVSIFELAASYSYGLAMNHPFIDGNKRISLTVAAVFLELNGYSLNSTEAEAVLIFQRLAAGNLSEPELANWIRDSSVLNA